MGAKVSRLTTSGWGSGWAAGWRARYFDQGWADVEGFGFFCGEDAVAAGDGRA